ncbi:MAG TPA: hypothetical protein VIO61_06440 [Anaerolineaceae bacterium]
MNPPITIDSRSSFSKHAVGWLSVAAVLLGYAALYTANYLLPMDGRNYTTRIWDWSQTSLMVVAIFITLWHWRAVTLRLTLLGFALAVLSGLSHWQHDPSLAASFLEGLAVWACFVAGTVLFEKRTACIPAFEPSLLRFGKHISLGLLLALPLTALNNLYFYLNAGSIHFQNVFASAFEALSPAIHEEIVFRFFVIALVLRLLQSCLPSRFAMPTAIFLAVVPHSLNHLPELFLENPVMGLFMLAATCLLFGLPMALLQIKRSLETAIAFHWFIDFARFLFGF